MQPKESSFIGDIGRGSTLIPTNSNKLNNKSTIKRDFLTYIQLLLEDDPNIVNLLINIFKRRMTNRKRNKYEDKNTEICVMVLKK